jgi:hypothetical protein
MEILKAGYIDEWILYELATQLDPQATLKVSATESARLHTFVSAFVLRSYQVIKGVRAE